MLLEVDGNAALPRNPEIGDEFGKCDLGVLGATGVFSADQIDNGVVVDPAEIRLAVCRAMQRIGIADDGHCSKAMGAGDLIDEDGLILLDDG